MKVIVKSYIALQLHALVSQLEENKDDLQNHTRNCDSANALPMSDHENL